MATNSSTIDLLKLRFYNEWLHNTHVYAEGDSQMHQQLTTQIVSEYIDPLNLSKDSAILDLGCGPGYFLDEMSSRGYTNVTGVTLSKDDIALCEKKGHTIKQYDLSFLPSSDGWCDESVDFIFLRHALEHSPYPVISLIEYNRVLRQGAKIYIEVPAPGCDRRHEYNPNHYSILGEHQLAALLERTGFSIDKFNDFQFTLDINGPDGAVTHAKEKYFCVVATKKHSLDIK